LAKVAKVAKIAKIATVFGIPLWRPCLRRYPAALVVTWYLASKLGRSDPESSERSLKYLMNSWSTDAKWDSCPVRPASGT
jgi:hypothetical protein